MTNKMKMILSAAALFSALFARADPSTPSSNPIPANGSTGVDPDTDLTWPVIPGADSYDVYFGTSSMNLTFQGNQAGTTFPTGTMETNTVYYWRIDPKNTGGTSTGDVWTFTTPTDSKPTWRGCWIAAWRTLSEVPTELVEIREGAQHVLYDLRGSGTCNWGEPQWNVPGERAVILKQIKDAGLNLVLCDWTNGIKDTAVSIAEDADSMGMKVASVIRGYGGDWDDNEPPLDEVEGYARQNWNTYISDPRVTNYLEYQGKPLLIIHGRPSGMKYLVDQMASASDSEIDYLSRYTLSFSHGFAGATSASVRAPFGFRNYGGTKKIRYMSTSENDRDKINAIEFERRCSWAANAEDIVIIGSYDGHGDSQAWGIANTSNAHYKDSTRKKTNSIYVPDDNPRVYYDIVQGIFATDHGDTAAPAAPTGLTATSGGRQITLDWADNTEGDLRYNIYHSDTSGGPYSIVAIDLTDSDYIDTGLAPDKTYYYVVTATDVNGRESVYSSEYSSATQSEPSYESGISEWWPSKPFDNVLVQSSSDGTAPSNVDAVENESNNRYSFGQSFTAPSDCTVARVGVHVDFSAGQGFVDKVALDSKIKLVLFDYNQTTFDNDSWGTYADPFAGQSSNAFYTAEFSHTEFNNGGKWLVFNLPTAQSLTAGNEYGFAVWISNPDSAMGDNSYGTFGMYSGATYDGGTKLRIQGETGNEVQKNRDLNFVIMAPDTTAPAAPAALTGCPGDGQIYLNWADNTEGDLDSYSLYRGSTSGGPYALVASGLTDSLYLDTGLTNNVTYNYVLMATDKVGNESGYSNEFSAIPKSSGETGTVTVSASKPSSNVVVQTTPDGTSGMAFDAEESASNIRYSYGQTFRVPNDCTIDKISVQYRSRSGLLDLVENDTQIKLILVEYDQYTFERDVWGTFTDPLDGQVSHDFYTAVLDWNTGAGDGSWLVFDLPTNQNLAKNQRYAFALWLSNPDSPDGGTEGGSLSLYFGGTETYADGARLKIHEATNNQEVSGDMNFVIQELVLPDQDFSTWVKQYDLGALTRMGDDPDGDDVPNALEAFFGSHPGEASAGLIALNVTSEEIVLTHPQSDQPPTDLQLSYSWSANLADWYDFDGADGSVSAGTEGFSSGLEEGMTTVTVTRSPEMDRFFLRLKVKEK